MSGGGSEETTEREDCDDWTHLNCCLLSLAIHTAVGILPTPTPLYFMYLPYVCFLVQ